MILSVKRMTFMCTDEFPAKSDWICVYRALPPSSARHYILEWNHDVIIDEKWATFSNLSLLFWNSSKSLTNDILERQQTPYKYCERKSVFVWNFVNVCKFRKTIQKGTSCQWFWRVHSSISWHNTCLLWRYRSTHSFASIVKYKNRKLIRN